jgi:tetratricopeptide (TPR) repeat protein
VLGRLHDAPFLHDGPVHVAGRGLRRELLPNLAGGGDCVWRPRPLRGDELQPPMPDAANAVIRLATAWVSAIVLSSASMWSSGRPPECGDPASREANVWERTKWPELRRYCDLVAGASSKLAGAAPAAARTDVPRALDEAREAERVLPGRAAPRVLEGRALARLGDFAQAIAALSDAKSREPRALDDPLALFAWARALARTGRRDEAAQAYRALLPRAAILPGAERASAEVEAGLVAMARGPAGLDEAAAALREAVRDAEDETRAVAVLALALLLDRRGDGAEARSLLGPRPREDPGEIVASGRVKDVVAVIPGEAHALAAMGLEGAHPPEPVRARQQWQDALRDAPDGPWAAHARGHLSLLASLPASSPASPQAGAPTAGSSPRGPRRDKREGTDGGSGR